MLEFSFHFSSFFHFKSPEIKFIVDCYGSFKFVWFSTCWTLAPPIEHNINEIKTSAGSFKFNVFWFVLRVPIEIKIETLNLPPGVRFYLFFWIKNALLKWAISLRHFKHQVQVEKIREKSFFFTHILVVWLWTTNSNNVGKYYLRCTMRTIFINSYLTWILLRSFRRFLLKFEYVFFFIVREIFMGIVWMSKFSLMISILFIA